jgi:hypothetical protein
MSLGGWVSAPVVATCLTLVLPAPLAEAGPKPHHPGTVRLTGSSFYHPGESEPFWANGDTNSPKRGCRSNRRIVLHIVSGGQDTEAGSDVSETRPGDGKGIGVWRIDTTHPASQFEVYAVMKAKVKRRYICKGDVSNTFVYP